MGPGDVFGLLTLMVGVVSVIVLRGPLGRAIADRIAGRSSIDGANPEDLHALQADLEEVKHRLTETEERLDFAERLLARQQPSRSLEPGGRD